MHGLCRGVDSSVFFHPDGERGRARAQRELRAKEMCRRCPVIAQCRSHALAVGEPYGIWGGLSESERELLLKRGIRFTSSFGWATAARPGHQAEPKGFRASPTLVMTPGVYPWVGRLTITPSTPTSSTLVFIC